MDDTRFDAWTRRRFGLATGGALAAALNPTAFDARGGRRKKRKKRCRKLHQHCRLDGAKPRCCEPMTCIDEIGPPPIPGIAACCRFFQTPCASDDQCCGAFRCRKAIGRDGKRCCASFDAGGCRSDQDCCAGDGVVCDAGSCCRRVRASCAASDECCGELVCDQIEGPGTESRCCSAGDGFCTSDEDCCEGFACNTADRQCVPG